MKEFPTIGIVGESALVHMFTPPALALGVGIVNFQPPVDIEKLAQCTVTSAFHEGIPISQINTMEKTGAIFRPTSTAMNFVMEWNSAHTQPGPDEAVFSVLVARSPHGQASAWTPSEIVYGVSMNTIITPAPSLAQNEIAVVQGLALDMARQAQVSGVMEVDFVLKQGELVAHHMSLGPSFHGMWTIEGARTSQFEQHLRAILDLPLGDPALLSRCVVTGNFSGEGNMYRPYLHLMARSPQLKFHQYPSNFSPAKGHVTAMGRDLLDLTECVTHAVEYMNGVIDE